MNRHLVTPLGFALVVFIIILFIPTFIVAQEGEPPSVPHKLEGRSDCLGCHAEGKLKAPKISDNPTHTGKTSDTCQECHQPATPPQVPHTLEGRENCLKCHLSAEAGAATPEQAEAATTPEKEEGAATLEQEESAAVPEQEAPPTPTPTAEPIPTPLAFPRAKGVNTCLDCHLTLKDDKQAEIATDWQPSIHAEREVICADCHGGNPSASTQAEAHAVEAGYIGKPAKSDIPALCAGCHADVIRMRQYDLPTDQFAKYQESIHGIRLAEGDEKVATCFDCHGGHKILKANDPSSSVYPPNVPATCAKCHADKELMAPYQIPTNQFDLYQQSVHGHALLDNQDFRAPNCATCHGTHGAAPPGFEEVANVCGSCHNATQDHYLKSPHANGGDELAPKCVTCHGRYDVSKPSEAIYLGSEPRHCGECHSADSEPGRVAQDLYDSLTTASQAYEEAEAAIQEVQEVGMLVATMEGRLREANTDLITARAVQHTLDLATVRAHTDKVVNVTTEVKISAETAIAQNIFRRRAMIIAVAIIGLAIVPLYLFRRELDRQLDRE